MAGLNGYFKCVNPKIKSFNFEGFLLLFVFIQKRLQVFDLLIIIVLYIKFSSIGALIIMIKITNLYVF